MTWKKNLPYFGNFHISPYPIFFLVFFQFLVFILISSFFPFKCKRFYLFLHYHTEFFPACSHLFLYQFTFTFIFTLIIQCVPFYFHIIRLLFIAIFLSLFKQFLAIFLTLPFSFASQVQSSNDYLRFSEIHFLVKILDTLT